MTETKTTTTTTPTTTKIVVKTQGRFTISSDHDVNFSYSGFSKQAEIMFRDYLNWCEKGKAPKELQKFYDAHKKLATETKPLFKLAVTKLDDAAFRSATAAKVSDQTERAKKLLEKLAEIVKTDAKVRAIVVEAVTKLAK
jgi:hypothetical protein